MGKIFIIKYIIFFFFIRIFINQRKNNLFFNVLNENNIKVYYNSVGLEIGKGSKSLSSSLIDILVYKLLKFTILYINLDSKYYFFFKGFIYKIFLKKKKKFLLNNISLKNKKFILKKKNFILKKIYIFIYLNVLNSYDFFLSSLLENINKFNLRFDKIFFLNNISHGNYKYKKSYY